MKQDMKGILQRGLNQVKSNLGLQGSRQILYLNDLLNTESKHNKANSAMTAILYEIHNNGRERGITSLIRFTLKDIQKKVIKKTCSLFTLSEVTLNNEIYYCLDIKYVSFDKEEIKNIIEFMRYSQIISSDLFLTKKGYIYNEDNCTLSIIYEESNIDLIENVDFSEVVSKNGLNELVNQNEAKFIFFNEFFKNIENSVSTRCKHLLFHPWLIFFDKTHQQIIYIDYIFNYIYQQFKEKLSNIVLLLYGEFEGDKFNNHTFNLLVCLIIYFFSSSTNNNIAFETILYAMRVDYANNKEIFESLCTSSRFDDSLFNFISTLKLPEEKIKSLLGQKEYLKLYKNIVLIKAVCNQCELNSRQKSSDFFTFIFEKKIFLCKNCLNKSDKKENKTERLTALENKVESIKNIFLLKRASHKKDFSKIYKMNCESVIKQSQANLNIAELYNLEKRAHSLISYISHKLRLKFQGTISKYSASRIDTQLIKNDMLNKISFLYNNYINIKNDVTQIDYETIQKTNHIINLSQELFNKDMNFNFSQQNESILSIQKDFVNKYCIPSNLVKLNTEDKFDCLCFLEKNTRRVHAVNVSTKEYSFLECPINIKKGTRYLNMQSCFFISGGLFSRSCYFLVHNGQSKTLLTNKDSKSSILTSVKEMIYEHDNHVLINVNNYIYAISGSYLTKTERYDILNDRWEDIHHDLPTPIIKASGIVINEIDLYLFYGFINNHQKIEMNENIYKLCLYTNEEKNNWETIKIRYQSPFEFRSSFCLIPYEENIILITGGKIKGEIKTDEFFSFNVNTNTIRREKSDPSWKNIGVSFSESYYFPLRTHDKKTLCWGVWGKNKKIIKIKRKLKA